MQQLHIARQPIFNRDFQLAAYEVLFRNTQRQTTSDDQHDSSGDRLCFNGHRLGETFWRA